MAGRAVGAFLQGHGGLGTGLYILRERRRWPLPPFPLQRFFGGVVGLKLCLTVVRAHHLWPAAGGGCPVPLALALQSDLVCLLLSLPHSLALAARSAAQALQCPPAAN